MIAEQHQRVDVSILYYKTYHIQYVSTQSSILWLCQCSTLKCIIAYLYSISHCAVFMSAFPYVQKLHYT